jgi:hypothetical protein
VVRTFESEGKEVWFVGYTVLDSSRKEEFVIATTDHPFRVKELCNYHAVNVPEEIYIAPRLNNVWLTTVELYRYQQDLCTITFELADGREADCDYLGSMLTSEISDVGVVYSVGSVGEGNEGIGIDFSKNRAEYLREQNGSISDVFAESDYEQPYDQFGLEAIAYITNGYVPLLRKVYNLAVEENHTYFVGELGVWVHDAIQQTS